MDGPRYGKPEKLLRGKTRSKFYYVRVNDGGTRSWLSTGCENEGDAENVVTEWKRREARGQARIPETIRFDKAAAKWLEEARDRGIAPKTAIVFGTYIRAWTRHFGRKPVRSIAREHIKRYLKLRAGKLNPRSLNNEKNRLASFFKFAIGHEWARQNPVHGIPAFLEEKKRPRALSEADELRLLEETRAGGEDLHGFTLCLLASGLRRGTVEQLTFDDVDWERGEWRISAGKMKSRERFDGRPIDPELFAWMKARRRPSGPIFGKLDMEKWDAAASRAGLDATPHSARRTFITRCRRRKVPMEVCMFLSDHRSIQVIIESYLEVTTEDAREALARRAGRREEAAS